MHNMSREYFSVYLKQMLHGNVQYICTELKFSTRNSCMTINAKQKSEHNLLHERNFHFSVYMKNLSLKKRDTGMNFFPAIII